MLSVFAAFAALGFAAAYVGPVGAALAESDDAAAASASMYATAVEGAQSLDPSVQAVAAVALDRGGYSVYVKPKPKPVAPKAAVGGWVPVFVQPDPGTAKAIAYDMVKARGWGDDQYACLVALFKKESGWRVNAYNSSSGAYGIPQALPGSKMASAGADWRTNPATQIKWGLGYVSGRYGTPCRAWAHSQATGWY